MRVNAREGEDFEFLMKRWKRAVNDADVLADIKKHEEFHSKAEKRREKIKAAQAKKRKAARRSYSRYTPEI